MGYEISFKYFKKKTEGFGYETEGEPEVMKVNVGKQWDDIELDEVAKAVFGQMAKRNILIVDAEICEYAKKKISFKMKDDGITIKNRKFSYDITGAIKSEDENVQPQMVLPDQPIIAANGQALEPHEMLRQQQRQVQPIAVQQDISHLPVEVQTEIRQQRQLTNTQRQVNPNERLRPILPPAGTPLRYEIYDPHPDIARFAKEKGLAFTIGKKYPIFQEKADQRGVMFGMIYVTEDNNGSRQILNDKHFVPVQRLSEFDSQARPNHISRVEVEENQVTVNGKTMNLPDVYTLGRRR